jgi:molybdopterin synthase catalytic subunit
VDTVPQGAPIVIVATAARHRREAFEAAMWIMDELKTRVPIWKQEEGKWVNDVGR